MAKSVGSSTIVVLLIALLLVASMELPVVEGGTRGCKQASKSMTTCTAHPECDKQCKGEKAKMGLCRADGPKGKKCWCYMC
ncbi:PREDICTED: defensin Tk-AMP-D1 [Prunus dulcis]|uniref:PREDICTED: defensin Tk-AMP-D1 n=1 Tax=Prunus dulcis TaxID=3755 RepID=A0A5E4GMQ6_PRUDU|nr:hypothetical protein L3X38_013126 [Prunus dulcis]KAI5345250.1 hypothetical protein L3X38_013127 [Prunus dulcis]KAI5345251.1 hypothetical protein L3X38_013128 [Prunus dulcis]KAI5345261.1 hypothetical protein L3X38_013138 [Prunus dulcis]VVA41177.1 PREDICTED: defensin Tk-AMP-D1 [Prunus dulcis]